MSGDPLSADQKRKLRSMHPVVVKNPTGIGDFLTNNKQTYCGVEMTAP
jgi:hypothetical protein